VGRHAIDRRHHHHEHQKFILIIKMITFYRKKACLNENFINFAAILCQSILEQK